MANTYSWTFGPIRGEDQGSLVGVVTRMWWKCTVTDDAGNTLDRMGDLLLDPPNPDLFAEWLPDSHAGAQAQRLSWLPAGYMAEQEAKFAQKLSDVVASQAAGEFTAK